MNWTANNRMGSYKHNLGDRKTSVWIPKQMQVDKTTGWSFKLREWAFMEWRRIEGWWRNR